MLEWFKRNKYKVIILLIILFIGIPIGVHTLYKIPAFCSFMEYEIPAGSLLSYIGSTLAFCGTITVSITALRHNVESFQYNKLESNKFQFHIDEEIGLDVFVSGGAFCYCRFSFEAKAFSRAIADGINVKNVSFSYMDEECSNQKYTVQENMNSEVERINENTIKITFSVLSDNQELKELLIGVRKLIDLKLDVEFKCGPIVTPTEIKMTIARKTDEKDEFGDTYLKYLILSKKINVGTPAFTSDLSGT